MGLFEESGPVKELLFPVVLLPKRDLFSPFDDSDKLLRVSTGKDVQTVMPLELGRGKLFFNKSLGYGIWV
jgi:hypothetical protein